MSVTDLLKSKGTKIGGGIIGGAGLLTLDLNLMNDKIDSVQNSINVKEISLVNMVDYKHESVLTQLRHLNEQQKEMKTLLEKIDQRVYEMNKKQLYSKFE